MKDNGIMYDLIEAGMNCKRSSAACRKTINEQSAFKLDDVAEGEIMLDTIDNCAKEEVAMIKMDVEGFEYKALLGAKNTISKWKPQLAICVYHKPEDIIEIPRLIHDICPEYHLYLRHYSLFENETVLYAI